MGVLTDIQQAIEQAAERSAGAVVGIRSRRAAGSGVLIGTGSVLTNAHNITGDEVEVVFADGSVAAATSVEADADGDLAVLTVDEADVPDGMGPVAWADVDGPGVGTAVVAMANPAGEGVRATFGTVSAVDRAFRGPRGRRVTGSFEHTAPLPRGSSGGPVLDADGALLGINTSRMAEGFYLALPADEALRGRLEQLRTGKSRQGVRLGVAIAPAHVARRLRAAVGLPEREGLLVHRVGDDTPADNAGLVRGDLLVGVGDTDLRSVDDLHRVLDGLAPGATIDVSVVRGVEELTVTVRFGDDPRDG